MRDQALRWLRFDDLVLAVDANDLDRASTVLSDLLSAVEGTDDAWLELDARIRGAMASIVAGDVRHGLDAMLRFSAEARALDRQETGVTAFRDTAVLAIRTMDYPTAALALDEGMVYADSIQQSHCAHVMAALQAELQWVAGRWDGAVADALQAIADPGCQRAPGMAHRVVGYVALGRGELAMAEAELRAALAFGERSEMIEYRLPARWGLAEMAVLAGDHEAAIAEVEAARALAEAAGERALFVPFIVTGVRAYQLAGRPEDAERWLRAAAGFLASTPAFGPAALAHGEGLVALASGATGIARRELEAAVEGWDAIGRVWEASWARLDLASAFLRTNRFAAGVSLAGQVQATADALGSPALRERAESLVRHGRGRVVDAEPWHPLTDPRVRGRSTGRGGPDQRRDRRGAGHLAQDGQLARRAHPGQARGLAACRDRDLGQPCRGRPHAALSAAGARPERGRSHGWPPTAAPATRCATVSGRLRRYNRCVPERP